jgi:aminopeptidase N
MVSPFDYRSTWLFEAMSTYAALEFLEQSKGRAALDDVLESYRGDLLELDKGATVESAGPIDFGERLLDNNGMRAWHDIIYEKGAWVLHMLRMRLGDDAFHALQSRIINEYQNKLITNEDFRRLAASVTPDDEPDKSLTSFFDNWIYSTGIPAMKFHSATTAATLKISGVDDGFSVDLPLRCLGQDGKEQVVWVHAGAGDNSFDMSNGNHTCQLPKQTDFLYRLN